MKRVLRCILQDAETHLTRRLYASRQNVVAVQAGESLQDGRQTVEVTLLPEFDPHRDFLMAVVNKNGKVEFERLAGCRRGYHAATFPERWRQWLSEPLVHQSATRYLVAAVAERATNQGGPDQSLCRLLSNFDETSRDDWSKLAAYLDIPPRHLAGDQGGTGNQSLSVRLALAVSARQLANQRWKPPLRRPRYDPVHTDRVYVCGPNFFGR